LKKQEEAKKEENDEIEAKGAKVKENVEKD